MWGIVQAVEALRSLATCPWETWLRRGRHPRPEPVWPLVGAPLGLGRSSARSGSTDLPVLGPTPWRVPDSWTVDPASGHDFGCGPSHRVSARPELQGADLLRCWVLGRGGDLLHAARRSADGDEDAVEHVEAWLEAFLAACPPGRGPQWSSAMEVALRAVRLLQAARLVAGEEEAPAGRRRLFERALQAHEAWLARHSEWRAHRTGNHFLVATAGRFLLASGLAPTPRRRREAARSWRLFWREWRRQVLEDGLHFESSTHYHLLVVDTALEVLACGSSAGHSIPGAARRRLVAAVEAVAALMRPDGTLAQVGDSDDGAFVEPEAGALEDARPLLRRAAELLNTSSQARMRPAAFPLGGLYVLAAAEPRALHCTVSGTGRGRAGTGGHGHDDCGSYELWAGRPIVVDRGTGSYTGDPALRERLRSSLSHSVLVADGRTQNPPVRDRPFRRVDRALPFLASFDPDAGGSVELGHHAWARGPGAVALLRRLELDPAGRLLVRDELTGRGRHELTVLVQWAPGLRLSEATRARSLLQVEASDERGVAALLSVEGEGWAVGDRPAEHCPRQGLCLPARCSALSRAESPPVVLRHRLEIPENAGEGPSRPPREPPEPA